MSTKELRSRREFLKDSSTIAAGAALASGLSLSIARSAHAQGGDTLRVALIGCGGRGHGAAANNLKACENTKIVAVADAFEAKAKNAAKNLGVLGSRRRPSGVSIPTRRRSTPTATW